MVFMDEQNATSTVIQSRDLFLDDRKDIGKVADNLSDLSQLGLLPLGQAGLSFLEMT